MLVKPQDEGALIKAHHRKLLASISDDDLRTFSALPDDEARFRFVHGLPTAHELPVEAAKSGKNGNVALKVKEHGNKAFQSGDYRSALQLYTKSILKAPWEKDERTTELSVLFANRSAAFFHLDLHSACLQDIATVLTLDYPLELRYKVLDRKARCLLALKQLKDAFETFRSTLTALDSSKLSPERRQKWQTDVQIMISMLNKNNNMIKGGLVNEPLPAEGPPLPPPSGGRNPLYPSASASVAVKTSNEMGRFAEASRDIRVGEVLVVEKPHCSVLLEEHCNTHCFHCFKKLLALVPCPRCSVVGFCSVHCQTEAMATHHGVECVVLAAVWDYGASVTCHMALRILTQAGLQHFTDRRQQLLQSETSEESNKYDGSDYRAVYRLVRHEASRTPADFLQRADMAVFLFRCLKVGGFFQQATGEHATSGPATQLTQTEVFIGGLLLRHLQLLQFNAHEISELHVDKSGRLDEAKSVFLGGGLYPTLALFNHSCDPGITRYFRGTCVVVRAVKNVDRGEMVGENYGPIFTQVSRAERQATLRAQYWFDCSCAACTEDWPRFEDMDPGVMRFKCDAEGQAGARCDSVILVPANTELFMIPCKACKEHTNILKGLKALQDTDALFRLATRHMENNEVNEALAKFIEILTLLSETLAPPFRDFHLCQQGIRRCMLAMGNKFLRS